MRKKIDNKKILIALVFLSCYYLFLYIIFKKIIIRRNISDYMFFIYAGFFCFICFYFLGSKHIKYLFPFIIILISYICGIMSNITYFITHNINYNIKILHVTIYNLLLWSLFLLLFLIIPSLITTFFYFIMKINRKRKSENN
jgi:hypothetical protein